MRILLFILGLLGLQSLPAQGGQRYYEGRRLLSLYVLPDGSVAGAGNAQDSLWYWLRTDAQGAVLEEQVGGAGSVLFVQALSPVAWRLWLNTGDSIRSVRSDGQGAGPALAGVLYKGVQSAQAAYLCGSREKGQGNYTHALSWKADLAGGVLWSALDSFGISATGRAAALDAEENLATVGTFVRSDTLPEPDVFCVKRNADGEVLWSKTLAGPDRENAETVLSAPDQGWIIAGSVQNASQPAYLDEDIWLAKLSADGDSLWSRAIPLPGFQEVHAAALAPNGQLALAGETRPSANSSRDAFLAVVDSSGALVWYRTYGGIRGDIFWQIQTQPDGGWILGGQSASVGEGRLRAWIVRTDSLGNVWSARLQGQVAADTVENCAIDAGEMPLAHWIIAADGAPGRYYTITDETGHYGMDLDTGIWFISVLPPAGYWTPCADSLPVIFQYPDDTLSADIPVQAAYHCPLMQVDMSTPFLRRCFENTYTVRYHNYGAASAAQVTIAVLPDPYLSVSGASAPFTTAGDTLWFEIGEVPVMGGGLFNWTAVLDCDSTVLGQSHCSEVWIFPDSLCYAIDPAWDGASLDVSGYCAGDSVVLTITNTGIGNMQAPVEYVITEDQIIFKQAPLQLLAGQSITEVVYPQGATVTLLVPQTAGHPGASFPMLVIEGCGGFPFSTGYAFQFPNDDGQPSRDIECRQNIGSYDPNDKTGIPLGVSEQGYIAPGVAIEYLIRFQNTGTDTAFRVEIRDTLPPGLDVSTFEQGGASHPFRWSLEGAGVLRYIFDPIALPDSNVNLSASQGFVKYRIATPPDVALGTRLQNRASIYFDFNAPVVTPPTLHTIGHPLDHLSASGIFSGGAVQAIRMFPNPARSSVQIAWTPPPGEAAYQLVVSDLQGRVVLEKKGTGSALVLQSPHLTPGFYGVKIFCSKKLIAAGRLLYTR